MQIAERDAVIKRVKANWASEWEKNLDAAERYAAGQVRAFYNSQAAIALDIFKRKGTIGADDVQFLYNTGDFTKIYEGLYESIGLRFAKWYTQNFDKLIKKGVNPSSLVEPWRAYFKLVGASVAAERVTLVQGAARKNLIDVTRRLTTDDVFINEGAEVRARMVRQKFDQYSQYQAERLVRTEATNIANIAVETAAEDIFPGTDMQKEWISATDTRTRRFTNKDFADHLAMDGEIVDFDKPFEVPTIRGVEFLMRPGDTSGSPGNVINCRCSMAPFPKEGAQTVGEISDLGFGVADTLTAEGLSQLGTVVQTAVQAAVVEANIVASKPAKAVDDLAARKEAMRPDNWNDLIDKNDIKNDDFLALLKNKINFVDNPNKGASYNMYTDVLTVPIKEKRKIGNYKLNKTLAHEFGHAVHIQQGWVKVEGKVDDIILKYFDKWEKRYGALGDTAMGQQRVDLYFKMLDLEAGIFDLSKRPSLFKNMSEIQYSAELGAYADSIKSITQTIGWGHDNDYFTKSNGRYRYFEAIAHAFENKYVGNEVFKHLDPEFYQELIDMLDELIAKTI